MSPAARPGSAHAPAPDRLARASRWGERAGWALLGALLLVTLAGAFLIAPAPRPASAASLAEWIPAAAARLWPEHGAAVANALLLAAAALLAARTLSRRLGAAAPAWVAAWLFGSVTFAYVFRSAGEIVLLAVTAGGFALTYLDESGTGQPRSGPLPDLYDGELTASRARFLARWAGAGALLALPGAVHPLYLLLLVPAFLAPPPSRRRPARLALVAGAAATLALATLLAASHGGWGDVAGLTPRPGLLLDGGLLGWNALYFLAGRDLGVLPYFLPIVLCFLAAGGERGRRALLLVVLLVAVGFLLLRPFDFASAAGSDALGNRAFLPLYAALWFLAARPAPALWAFLALALAAPFVYPLWLHPAPEAGGWPARVSEAARLLLPYETTQATLPGGQEEHHDGLWTRLLDPDLGRIGEAESIKGDETGELLVASRVRLRGLVLPFDPRAPTRLHADGQELRPSLLRPDGAVVFQVPLSRPRAKHPTAWSGGADVYFYEVTLRLPGAPPVAIGFRALPQEELPSS